MDAALTCVYAPGPRLVLASLVYRRDDPDAFSVKYKSEIRKLNPNLRFVASLKVRRKKIRHS
jgi:hypothetical protein